MLKPITGALLLAATVPAAAITAAPPADLPSPYYSSSFESFAYNVDTDVVTHYAAGEYSDPTAVTDPFLDLTVAGTPTPFINVRAHGSNGVSADGGGNIEYYFAVAGPASIVVPLRAHIIIDATVGTGAFDYGGGQVSIYTDQSDISRSASADHGGSVSASAMIQHARVDEWVPFSASAGGSSYQNSILIGGAATVEAGRHVTGYTDVFVDPVITIDPVWAAAHPGYSLSFSPGVGNSPNVGAVPEPGNWALLVAGFAAVGTVARRRRRAVVAA